MMTICAWFHTHSFVCNFWKKLRSFVCSWTSSFGRSGVLVVVSWTATLCALIVIILRWMRHRIKNLDRVKVRIIYQNWGRTLIVLRNKVIYLLNCLIEIIISMVIRVLWRLRISLLACISDIFSNILLGFIGKRILVFRFMSCFWLTHSFWN